MCGGNLAASPIHTVTMPLPLGLDVSSVFYSSSYEKRKQDMDICA